MENPEELLALGVALFNRGEYFDAHEVWEDVWHETRGPEKLFIQGLIQMTTAWYHLGNANLTGAFSLFSKSLEKLNQFPQITRGINTEAARTAMARQIDLLHEAIIHGLSSPGIIPVPPLVSIAPSDPPPV